MAPDGTGEDFTRKSATSGGDASFDKKIRVFVTQSVLDRPMLSRFLILLLMLSVPSMMQAQREKLPPDDYEWVTKNFPSAKKSNTGIRYIEIESGSGDKIKRGDKVSVLYIGRFINGETFDKQVDPQTPLKFRVGRGKVIRGWDQILQLMRPGAKWLIIVPPELGYGTRGFPPLVPPEMTLIFTLQVTAVERN